MNYAVTNDLIRGLILEMPTPVFDSHALIFRIMQQYPREYTTDAYAFIDTNDAILQHHASLGKRFAGIDLIEPTRRVTSMNVRGENTENQEWRRV